MLMVFDQIMSLTKGGPAQSTRVISYLIYNGMAGGCPFLPECQRHDLHCHCHLCSGSDELTGRRRAAMRR